MLIKLQVNPQYGWGWHKDGVPFSEPSPFQLEIEVEDGRQIEELLPLEYYQGTVVEKNHILTDWSVKLSARHDPVTYNSSYNLEAEKCTQTDMNGKSCIVGYASIRPTNID